MPIASRTPRNQARHAGLPVGKHWYRRCNTAPEACMASLRQVSLTPCRCSACKPKIPRFAEQQRAIQLRHLADVISQQGDPLELAQILAAVHPELQGTQVNPMNTGANRYEHPCSSTCCYKHHYKPRFSCEADDKTRQAVLLPSQRYLFKVWHYLTHCLR